MADHTNTQHVFVRIPKRISKVWVVRHERDGLDEFKLSTFLHFAYQMSEYEKHGDLLVFAMRFQKRGGAPMRARLWVRERKINSITELVLIKAHAEPI